MDFKRVYSNYFKAKDDARFFTQRYGRKVKAVPSRKDPLSWILVFA